LERGLYILYENEQIVLTNDYLIDLKLHAQKLSIKCCDPEMLFQAIYPKELKTCSNRNLHTKFIVALFT
jgi:hypothetical protein